MTTAPEHSGWVPTAERLPEFTCRAGSLPVVFVIAYSDEAGVGEYMFSADGWEKVGVGSGVKLNVTDWMPLPNPPALTR